MIATAIMLEEQRRYRESIQALTTDQLEECIEFLNRESLRRSYTSHLAELRAELQRRAV